MTDSDSENSCIMVDRGMGNSWLPGDDHKSRKLGWNNPLVLLKLNVAKLIGNSFTKLGPMKLACHRDHLRNLGPNWLDISSQSEWATGSKRIKVNLLYVPISLDSVYIQMLWYHHLSNNVLIFVAGGDLHDNWFYSVHNQLRVNETVFKLQGIEWNCVNHKL